MIQYPLSVLMLMGVRRVLVVTSPDSVDPLRRLLGDGASWGLDLSIHVQLQPDGIVGCILSVPGEIEGRPCAVILGDNFFFGSHLATWLDTCWTGNQASIITSHAHDPRAFAVVERDVDGHVVDLCEKPALPVSNEIATGLYLYPCDLVERASEVALSERGEREVTSLNKAYLEQGRLDAHPLPRGSLWFDCGTASDLLRASSTVSSIEQMDQKIIASLEEIAWRKQWIASDSLFTTAINCPDEVYRDYLIRLLDAAN